jgi:hypothetical protein
MHTRCEKEVVSATIIATLKTRVWYLEGSKNPQAFEGTTKERDRCIRDTGAVGRLHDKLVLMGNSILLAEQVVAIENLVSGRVLQGKVSAEVRSEYLVIPRNHHRADAFCNSALSFMVLTFNLFHSVAVDLLVDALRVK